MVDEGTCRREEEDATTRRKIKIPPPKCPTPSIHGILTTTQSILRDDMNSKSGTLDGMVKGAR
jgi:hypothetical protein